MKSNIDPKLIIQIILPTHPERNLPSQTPDTQNVPLHSVLVPHLHVPDSQLSDVELSHIGLRPHIQDSEVQVSDNPIQSSFLEQPKILVTSQM